MCAVIFAVLFDSPFPLTNSQVTLYRILMMHSIFVVQLIPPLSRISDNSQVIQFIEGPNKSQLLVTDVAKHLSIRRKYNLKS